VECPQYSIRLEELGYLCTSCLLSAFATRPSVTRLNSHCWLAAYDSYDRVISALVIALNVHQGPVLANVTRCVFLISLNYQKIPWRLGVTTEPGRGHRCFFLYRSLELLFWGNEIIFRSHGLISRSLDIAISFPR